MRNSSSKAGRIRFQVKKVEKQNSQHILLGLRRTTYPKSDNGKLFLELKIVITSEGSERSSY